MIVGDPNSWKTTSLLTWDKPLCILSSPGEKGTDIVPVSADVKVLLWEPVDWSQLQDWKKIRDEIMTETAKVLRGDYGKFATVAFDGVHKVYDVFREYAKTQDEDGRRYYPAAQLDFLKWFSGCWYARTAPQAVWTVWAASERDDPDNPKSTAKSVWPNFMGQLQKSIVGETNCIYSGMEGGKAYWQLKQDAKIKGIGLKLPPSEAEKLPYKIEPSWQVLKTLLLPRSGVVPYGKTS